jgi:hypothetical protein
MAGVFGDFHGVLFTDFLIEKRNMYEAHYSELLKDRVKSVFLSK